LLRVGIDLGCRSKKLREHGSAWPLALLIRKNDA
jgi:hypothetical protein